MDILRVQIGGLAFIRAWAFIRDFTVYGRSSDGVLCSD